MNQQSINRSRSNWLLSQLGFLYLFFGLSVSVFSQSPSGNIDQASNGKLSSPNDPVNWVNGDLNETTNHYLEAQSIPYRVKIDRVPLGVPIKVIIEFDVRHNGHVSIDYLTSYDQPGPHALKYGAGHIEAIDPSTGILSTSVTPVYADIPSPGTKNSALGYINQPEASFNLMQAAGKTKMTLFNASFDGPLKWVTGLEPDYDEANATHEAQLEVTFIANALPVVFAWGGHIASRFDWGYLPNGQPRSAGGITGASYHTRLKTMYVDGVENSLGNQDMSLKVAAPICNLDLVVNSQTNIKCFGDINQGSLTLLASGGITPYSYSIDTGRTYQSSDQFSSLKSGSYMFWVRDQIGCIDSVKATITQPDSALMSMSKVTDVNCFGDSTGSIDHSVYGGTRAYSFDWSNGAKTEDLINLKAGQYIVTITDKSGCVLKDTFAVAQPDSALLSMGKVTDVNCFGDSTGSIDLSVYGGTRAYSFSWSNGAKTEDLSNLKAGQYIVTITDANGCVLKDTFAVAQPDSALLSMGKVTDVNCFGDSTGSIDLSVYGGTRAYSFDWSNGAKTEDLINLKAGQYIVTITDKSGCVLKDTFAVAQPDSALLSMGKVTDVNCFGDSTGSIDLSVYGGTRAYSFSWSNGAKTEDLINLKAGQYIVTITDANGCVLKDTFAVAQSAPLVVTAYDTTVCAKERILLRASLEGGVWSGTGIDGNYFEWPTPGTYKVLYTYTNEKGCVAKDTATVTVKLCETGFCTYTQGYYGNKGGKACFQGQKITTKGLIQKALLVGPIILGKASLNKTFTVSYNAADTVIMILPGGGPSAALTYSGNRTPSTLPANMLKNGRIHNGLLAQTLTLALNMRVNEGLCEFELLSGKYLITQDKTKCGSDSVKNCAYHSYRLNNKIVQALGIENTVSGLLEMANKALAGVLPGGLSYSDINGAVDLINNAFDGCRVGWYSDSIVYCKDVTPISSNLNNGFVQPEKEIVIPQVVAYPNPFRDQVTFRILMPENGKGSLSIYTATGQLLATVFEQHIAAGNMFTYEFRTPEHWKGNLFYVFRFNGRLYSGKLMKE